MAETTRPGPPTPRSAAEHDAMAAAARAAQAQRDEQEVRDQAEAATAHLPKPGVAGGGPMTAEQYVQMVAAFSDPPKPPEAMVKCNFPVPVLLTLPSYQSVQFEAGIQDVPVSLLDEEYLKDNKVTRV